MLLDYKSFKRIEISMEEITREGLLASAENESTYFMDFNTKCNDYGLSYVYCFVENYDLCFYPHRVEDIMGRKATGIPCEGKSNVLKVFALVKSKPEYDKYTTRFFVDADFDDNSTIDPHIYVTPCYSIENLFMEEEVVSKILENEYKIRPNSLDGKHQLCMNLYRKELTDFHKAVLLFNSWYCTVKHKGLTKEMKVNLSDSIPSDMVDLTIGSIRSLYTKADIETKYPLAPVTTEEEMTSSSALLVSNPKALRGKYEIQFLHKFFEYINADAKGPRQYTIIKKGVNMERNRMISTLDNYVSTPLDMREYIINGVRVAA